VGEVIFTIFGLVWCSRVRVEWGLLPDFESGVFGNICPMARLVKTAELRSMRIIVPTMK
jgi:hypothetical protein